MKLDVYWLLLIGCIINVISVRKILDSPFDIKQNLNFKSSQTSLKLSSQVGDANLDWKNLGFQYRDTDSFVFSTYKNGKWSELDSSSNPYIPIHIGATALHYGTSPSTSNRFSNFSLYQVKPALKD